MKTIKTIRQCMCTLFLLGWMFSFSACSGFYHPQYRKVKKVPAIGLVETPGPKEFKSEKKKLPSADSSFTAEVKIKEDQNDSVVVLVTHKRGYDLLPAIQKQVVPFSAFKIMRGKTRTIKPALRETGKPKSVLLIIGLLFLGFGLVLFGGSIIALAVYTSAWLMVALGIALLLLGMFPFFVLLTYVFEKRHNLYKE